MPKVIRSTRAAKQMECQVRGEVRLKDARRTSREADVLLAKITRADDCQRISERYLRALERIPDSELDRIGQKSPSALAIPAGILMQNLERLTAKPHSPVTINLDLSGAAAAVQRIRDGERDKRELRAEIDALRGQLSATATAPATVIDVPAEAVVEPTAP